MKIAVLGLGIIRRAWAKNLIVDGHAVRCWNRTPRDFPNFYPAIQDAVEETEAIFVIVSDPPAVQSVLDQITLAVRKRNGRAGKSSAGRPRPAKSPAVRSQWNKIAPYLVTSGDCFLCGSGVLALLIWKADTLVRSG